MCVLVGVCAVCLATAAVGTAKSGTSALDQPGGGYLLKPTESGSAVAYWVARLLERHHYLQRPLDVNVSTSWFDRFITDLDYQHMHYLASDLEALSGYRTNLVRLVLRRGDTTPAYVMFSLFMRRLEQRVRYVTNLLDTEEFDFTGNERVVLNRRDQPFPRDLDEARRLWRERLRAEYLEEKLAGKDHREIVDTLKRRYSRTFRLFREWDSENVLEFYLSALARSYDPHSVYMGKSQTENFAISMNLSLSGIGATLTSEDGYCKIIELVPGGPAHRSKKLRVGDRIVAVAQSNEPPVDIVDMPLAKAVQLIRGPKGTEVRLTIIPADAADKSVRREVRLIRDEINLKDRAARGKMLELRTGDTNTLRVGIIELPSFYGRVDVGGGAGSTNGRSCSADVSALIDKLVGAGARGLVLDMRHNGGGSLEEAVKVVGLFVKSAPVVLARDADGSVVLYADRDGRAQYTGPLMVLVDRFSASGAEIVAAALQDYGRALLVGDACTHGKGTVQSLIPLKPFVARMVDDPTNDPGTLKLTIRKYYRVTGVSAQLKGVIPDIVLPSVNNVAEIGEQSLEGALAWDTIEPVEHPRLWLVQPYLDELRRRSAARVSENIGFRFVQEDMELLKKRLSDKSVSLNEAERRREKQELEQRDKLREQKLKQIESVIVTNWVVVLDEDATEAATVTAVGSEGPANEPEPATATTTANSSSGPDTEEELEKSTGPDLVLEEGLRIMLDWYELMGRDPVAFVSNAVVSAPAYPLGRR